MESRDTLPDIYPQKRSSEKNVSLLKQGKIVLCIIAAVVVCMGLISLFLFSSQEDGHYVISHSLSSGRYLAVVYIEGVIEEANTEYDQQWLLDTIETLMDDKKNVGLLLHINSPGGGVYQADEVYLALKEYAQTKHVWAYLGALAASGGYYIAAASDYIVANRNTLTGSIGVIAGQSLDLSSLMEKYGVKMTTVTAGRNKNMMNINEPFTDEQRAIMQSVADECYEQFVDIVSESRGLSVESVRELADGRIYTAKQALNNGLVDEILSFDDTVDSLLQLISDSDSVSVIDFSVQWKPSLYDYLKRITSSMQLAVTEQEGSFLIDRVKRSCNIPFPAYYWNGF